MAETILKTEYSDVMQTSYINYSMSVITARAVPDVRDGLKPVQRRVLYAMNQLGLNYDKPHRKSARIVGDTMGKYHPHGDSSIYETLVVMEQDFKKGMALVDGHGNFGSIEGDGAAAMRYTEARLKKFTQDVYLKDLDKDVVDFVPNFDETEKEPSVLPVRVPNILINGSEGIAVGMTTSIPTHNLTEVINAVEAYMDNEDITTAELMEYMPGPDFPTGGRVVNKSELLEVYETGSGKIKLRGNVVFEPAQNRSERDKLVINAIPYTMIGAGISKFMSDILDLIETKKTQDIVDVSNESSKEGIRIVLELRKNADVKKLENLLYKKTKLEDTFGVNMLTIADGRPEVLGLKDIIRHNVNFQYEINTRKYTTLLKKEYDNKEIKEGLIKACNIIDLIIEVLRGSTNLKQAKACLMSGDITDIKFKSEQSKKDAMKLHFTERQASAILELKLYRLIGLEIEALEKEYEETLLKIAQYEEILGSRKAMKRAIKKDLENIKKEYGVERLTVIEDGEEAVYEEPAVIEQEVVFIMDRFGYAKTIDKTAFERNRDAVYAENKYVFTCMNTEKICIFTDNGNLHQIKLLDIPFGRFRDKGTPIDNLGNYSSEGEEIVYLCSSEQLKGRKFLFVTQGGMMKLVDGSEFEASKKTIAATKLNEDDKVMSIVATDARIVESEETGEPVTVSSQTIVLQSCDGYFLKFPLTEIPEKKKGAVGVRGIKLAGKDKIDDVYVIPEGADITVDFRGKELSLGKLKMAKRDGKGTKVRA
ncbi:MAG: DNA topoisomerase (ATP-hydrolyzing) subunit A [Butyrivibrio sp.]